MSTILIVDDLAANRKVLVTLLRHAGHRLLEASDGVKGLAAVQAERPDLIITDVLMPVMDGYEFVRQLRGDPATTRIPVVFYTAHYGQREATELARSSGVFDVLTKPVEAEQVLAIVNRLLPGEFTLVPDATPLPVEFDREHLRLLTDKLSDTDRDLTAANARLRALINIGLELASERDSDRLLQNVCVAARDLFGASYVTLGILNRTDDTLQRLVTDGTDVTDWIQTGDSAAGILHTVVTERRTLRGENVTGDPATLQLPYFHPAVHAFLAAPIASPTHVYGWICLVGNEGRTFTDDDEAALVALSGQVGRTYENGYFYLVAQNERDRAERYLDTAEVILLALDIGGRITQVNRHACAILGWTAEELLGRDWIETCVPRRMRDVLRKKFENVMAGDLAIVENPILTRSGEERLIEWRHTVLRDRDGVTVGTFSSGADITERNQTLEALRTAEERVRFALQSADVGIWDLDYSTGKLQWSDILEGHYGLQPGTFDGAFESFIARVHPEDRQSVIDTVARAVKSGRDFSVQNRAIWPDGTVRWLAGAGRILLDEHGVPVRGVGISQDVTERRSLEDRFQQAQKMEAVGQLAGGIAHDFNNVLTAILGFTELMIFEQAPDDPLRADLLQIKRAGERAAGLTRQLLAFGRKQILQPRVLDINVIVGGMESMLKRLIQEHVNLMFSLTPGIGLVRIDPTQLEQILVNLVVNAADAMPRGGRLTIETANVQLDENYQRHHLPVTPGDYVMLAVSDSGVGMDEATRRRIFEPFYTTKGVGKGTGLGLSTVYGIVKQSGGDIWVYSELDRGSTFKIYLPRVTATVSSSIERSAETGSVARGSETILLVEDDDGVRRLAGVSLERAGYHVLQAGNPKEAIRVAAECAGPIHLLLSDVVMPESEGPPLFDRLSKVRPGLRVLYMSGYADEAIVRQGVLVEGTPFLQKPFTPLALMGKVRDVLDTAPLAPGR